VQVATDVEMKELEVGCHSIERMRVANALCLFVEGSGSDV
jgi:hypothetical protein